VKSVMVLGAGVMGSGIAQVLAQAGIQVFLRDIKPEFVVKGMSIIDKNLVRLVEKNKISSEEKEQTMANITGIIEIKDGSNVDLVIEAVSENMSLKEEIYKEISSVFDTHTIFATNTSGLSISALAAITGRPEKFIGMHFFNPVPVMQLVEVVKGAATSEETYNAIMDLVKKIQKVPVTVEESPGFVVNRMLIPMINEAAFILMEGVASAEDIDASMKLGANYPIGPLALGDLIGLDVCLSVMDTLHQELGEKFSPCFLLRKLVRAGYLGRKTGKGFFEYK